MRDKLEAGILTLSGHESWVDQFIGITHANSDKLKLIKVDLQNERFVSAEVNAFTHADIDYPSPEILQRIHFLLDRFDVILLPVSQASLVWNRVLLAQTQRQLNRPLVALSIDTNPIAFIHLKELGLSEFVSTPMNTDELRVRILSSIETYRCTKSSLEEGESQSLFPSIIHVDSSYQATTLSLSKVIKPTRRRLKLFDAQVTAHEAFRFDDSFKMAKANVVMEFERKYIVHALMQSNGNIGQAARTASKHRRAFWELMRKHGIDAANYRDLL